MWIAVGLVAGGALGNLIDRVRAGVVTDYVEIGSWPPFNLADVAITAGVVLFALIFLREGTVSAATPRIVHLDDVARRRRQAGRARRPPGPLAHAGRPWSPSSKRCSAAAATPSARASSTASTRGPAACSSSPAPTRPTRRSRPQVRRREVDRIYLALAGGRLASRTGTIDAPIGRASRQRHRMAVSGAASRAGAHPLHRARAARPRRPTSRRGWRPAAPTRSAPISPPSAIR